MAERIILCGNCGTKNRIPEGKSGEAKCGKCSHSIFLGHGPRSDATIATLVVAAIFAIGLLIVVANTPSSTSAINSASIPTTQSPVGRSKSREDGTIRSAGNPAGPSQSLDTRGLQPLRPNLQPIAVQTGILYSTGSNAIAPLTIITAPGANYYLKVVIAKSDQAITTAFIEGGRSLSFDVPLGVYEIRYASGSTWYGPHYLFGSETLYSKADKVFEFNVLGNQIRGYTVQLIKQVGGNLNTHRINPAEF